MAKENESSSLQNEHRYHSVKVLRKTFTVYVLKRNPTKRVKKITPILHLQM